MTVRTALAASSTCRRRQRSSRTPANGPTSVYGSTETAKAPAAACAVVARSGEKNTRLASAAWNAPSLPWETSRTANSRRNPRPRSTVRRSETNVTGSA